MRFQVAVIVLPNSFLLYTDVDPEDMCVPRVHLGKGAPRLPNYYYFSVLHSSLLPLVSLTYSIYCIL